MVTVVVVELVLRYQPFSSSSSSSLFVIEIVVAAAELSFHHHLLVLLPIPFSSTYQFLRHYSAIITPFYYTVWVFRPIHHLLLSCHPFHNQFVAVVSAAVSVAVVVY